MTSTKLWDFPRKCPKIQVKSDKSKTGLKMKETWFYQKRAHNGDTYTQRWQSTIYGQFWKMPKTQKWKIREFSSVFRGFWGPENNRGKKSKFRKPNLGEIPDFKFEENPDFQFQKLIPKMPQKWKIKGFNPWNFEKSKSRKKRNF